MAASRILVIEDDDGARDALGCLLSEEGYTVRTASSGRAALRCASEFEPDAIVCDYYLPDLDGLQVLRRLRATGRDIFIIVVSAGRYDEGAGLALRSEADVFLDKPIDLDRLRRALERVPSVATDAVRALS
jgi:DNA-binding response OmpR family regulator